MGNNNNYNREHFCGTHTYWLFTYCLSVLSPFILIYDAGLEASDSGPKTLM